jgi:hypothetical protein
MRESAEGGSDTVLLTASLSRISRHLGKLMRAMEYLLAHDAPILTANYLRPLMRSGCAAASSHPLITTTRSPPCGTPAALQARTAPQPPPSQDRWNPGNRLPGTDAACSPESG